MLLGSNVTSASVDLPSLQRRVRVAQGLEPGDLVLAGGQVVNVFTGGVSPGNVVIADGVIAGVGAFDWPARQMIDVRGKSILPGFIDSHMHLESTLLSPAEFARLVVPHGTSAIVADPHEIGNVQGIRGIDLLLAASRGLPLDFFFMAPSCVPAQSWEDSGAVLGPREVQDLLGRERILGLAEMMDFPAILRADTTALEKVRLTEAMHKRVDGHAPGLASRSLLAYAAAGIRSDHESTTVAEARAKAELGMLVQVREGSMARNLDALLPLLVADELGDFWSLVTDDIYADDLAEHGHLDGLLRRVVAAGVPAARAVRHVTLVPARHYGLLDRGAVAPSYRADLVVVDDLSEFRADLVLHAGAVAARDGRFQAQLPEVATYSENTVHVREFQESAFKLQLRDEICPVIRIIPGQILTRREDRRVRRVDGHWSFDRQDDVLLIASIERHRATGRIGLGLVSGFGISRPGAIGSSVAHDSHNLIVAGTNARDMLACVRALAASAGGLVVAAEGEVRSILPLPTAGLLSTEPADVVCRQLAEVRSAAHNLGCSLPCPFGILSFLALSVIPELRITDQGLYDVLAQQFVKL